MLETRKVDNRPHPQRYTKRFT